MTSAQRGNVAEAAVLHGLIRREFNVLVPFGSGHPYDLVLQVRSGPFLRVQCKRAWAIEGCIVFNSRSTDHGRGPQSYLGVADLFGVYFPPADQVYLVPIAEVPGFEGRLRLEPTRNSQKRGIRFAVDFEIGRWADERLEMLAPATWTSAT